jgi:pimeloyl-ACP methyl ester carboxylesterase
MDFSAQLDELQQRAAKAKQAAQAAVSESRRSAASPALGAHPGHLGAARSLPRPRARRARPDDVPNLDRVERLPDASHWVHHDEAERVNQLLIDFFAPAPSTEHR